MSKARGKHIFHAPLCRAVVVELKKFPVTLEWNQGKGARTAMSARFELRARFKNRSRRRKEALVNFGFQISDFRLLRVSLVTSFATKHSDFQAPKATNEMPDEFEGALAVVELVALRRVAPRAAAQ